MISALARPTVPSVESVNAGNRLARLAPRVYRRDATAAIRRAILDGLFPPGSPLVERRIADELGVSRGPVREALHKLEEEGLVVTTPYKVTQVAEVGLKRIQEITSLRETLEPLAVRDALPGLRRGGISELWRLLEEMRAAGATNGPDGLIELHLAFHRTFYDMADNALLLQFWTLMEGQTRLFLHVHQLPSETLSDYAEHHLELLQVLERGADDAIGLAVTRHIERVRKRLVAAHSQ
jgi:DNA-binding GntR family transcriptional regulator